jgi:hypothetical protein
VGVVSEAWQELLSGGCKHRAGAAIALCDHVHDMNDAAGNMYLYDHVHDMNDAAGNMYLYDHVHDMNDAAGNV